MKWKDVELHSPQGTIGGRGLCDDGGGRRHGGMKAIKAQV